MTVVAARVAIVGATGITGGLAFDAAVEMGLAPIAVGRNRDRLAAFVAARGLGGDRFKVVDQTAPADLSSALSDVDAVISTVAPFGELGMAVASAAAELGLGYTDPSGESGFIQNVIGRLDPVATANGATLCSGNGMSAFLGDIAISSIVDVDRDRLGAVLYDIQGYAPSAGSLKSYLSSILPSGAPRIRGGKVELVRFADYAGSVNGIPGYNSVVPDALVVSRYWNPERFDGLGKAGIPRFLACALGAAVTDTFVSRTILKVPLDKRLTYKSKADARSTVTVHAEVSAGNDAVRRCSIRGRGIYATTGRILAATIVAMLQHDNRPVGVRAASEMFGSIDEAMAATRLERLIPA